MNSSKKIFDLECDLALAEQKIKKMHRLIELIHVDLSIRADEGVVNVSDFIWCKITKHLKDKS